MFLARARAEHAAPPLTLANSTLALLQAYAWPGNVRELRNVIERGAVLCRGDCLLPEHLPPKLANPVAAPASAPPATGNSSAPPFGGQKPLAAAERQQILDALDRCAGNQTRAAEVLGISRRTLVTRLNEFDIPRPRKRT
jgi:DNA-binding NtrC family response regulator